MNVAYIPHQIGQNTRRASLPPAKGTRNYRKCLKMKIGDPPVQRDCYYKMQKETKYLKKKTRKSRNAAAATEAEVAR